MIAKTKKNALVFGLGRSGLAASKLLIRQGWLVTALDEVRVEHPGSDVEALMESNQLKVHDGSDPLPKQDYAFAVISPGIPKDHVWVKHCEQHKIPVVSELELGWYFCPGKVLAITGTNGKTTLVNYCEKAIRLDGHSAISAGNIGLPLCEAVSEYPARDWYVVEVSSFQLEHVYEFKPDIGILLNIYPNHLDRHGSMEEYRRAKLNLFKAMESSHQAVVHHLLLDQARKESLGEPDWVSFGTGPSADFWTDGDQIFQDKLPFLNFTHTYFDHPTYGENLAAASAALCGIGIRPRSQQKALQEFNGLSHRFEKIGELNGVTIINDSKATNLSATSAALRACDRPVHLIAGGVLKESDLNSLKEILARQATCVYLIGCAAEQLLEAWMPVVPCVSCDTLDQAVHAAWSQAKEGEAILLSPGCASFDQFNGYEERGESFRRLIKQITVEKAL